MEEANPNISENKLTISSKKKWFWLGLLVALVNPIFAGLIMGAVYLSEPELKRSGLVISAVAVVWGALMFYLMRQNFANPLGL